MKFKPLLSLLLVVAFGITSCTMVKNPQSANFQRVKYNSHLKLAKNHQEKKLPETVSSFEKNTKLEQEKPEKIEPVVQKEMKPLLASTNSKVLPKKATKVDQSSEIDWSKIERKQNKKKELTTIWNGERTAEANINSYIEAAPLGDVDTGGLGDILYIILVVLLILIVISLIAELAGGLVGALIAVLLILLLLRILGYV